MFARSVLTIVLFSCIQYSNYAKSEQTVLAADGLGLMPASESAALTVQAKSGLASATKVFIYRSREKLRNYKTIFNSSAILANFPVSNSEQEKLNLMINEVLGKSRRVTIASPTEADSTVYTAISIQKLEGDLLILEVLVAVSDWAEVQQKKTQGMIHAFGKSTIWASVSRRQLSWADASDNGQVVFEKMAQDIEHLYRNNVNQILVVL